MSGQKQYSGMESYRILDSLKSEGSLRKLRLFACGACRQKIAHLLVDERSWQAIEVAESYAEGETDRESLRKAWLDACEVLRELHTDWDPSAQELQFGDAQRAATAAAHTAHRSRGCARSTAGMIFSIQWYRGGAQNEEILQAERASNAVLVNCVFGNLIQSTALSESWHSWHDGVIPKMAQEIYNKRELPSGALDLTRMSVLADALEESGCDNQEILDHCRGDGPHVRGCWVIDLVLGKS